jgi:hypothetical protein
MLGHCWYYGVDLCTTRAKLISRPPPLICVVVIKAVGVNDPRLCENDRLANLGRSCRLAFQSSPLSGCVLTQSEV